ATIGAFWYIEALCLNAKERGQVVSLYERIHVGRWVGVVGFLGSVPRLQEVPVKRVAVALLLALGAVGPLACSSPNGQGEPSPTPDAAIGKKDTRPSGGGDDAPGGGDD